MKNDIEQIKDEIVYMEIRKKTYELRGFKEAAEMCDFIIAHLSELLKYKEKDVE